jgi:hypothetical protein
LGDTIQCICETWSARHYRDAHTTGELAVGSCHDARSGLMVRQHEFNTEITRRSNHVEIGAASWYAENAIYPELAESSCEVLRQALAHD